MISVVIPVYNLEKELKRCVNSVIAQTYNELEIILVDDESTDSTPEIIKELCRRDERIRTIRVPHGGALKARLAGVREARGEWIGFVDGDDIIEPQMYECLLSNALKYNAEIAHCGYVVDRLDGGTVYCEGSGQLLEQKPFEVLFELASDNRMEWWSVINKLFRYTLFSEEIYDITKDVRLDLSEDLFLNYLLICRANKLVYEDRCWYHYVQRMHSTSVVDTAKKRLDRIDARRLLRDYSPAALRDKAQESYLSACVKEYTYLLRKKESEEILSTIRECLLANRADITLLEEDLSVLAEVIIQSPEVFEIVVTRTEEKRKRKKLQQIH